LDKVTSGILLFAKSSQVAHELSEAFKNKNVTKYYVALTNKKAKKKKQGWVKGDMVQSRRKTWKLMNTFDNPASTRFFTAGLGNCHLELQDGWECESEQNCANDDNGQDDKQDERLSLLPKTMILFRPHTGKTHQLRVAAKSLGMPILGDQTYSDAIEAKSMKRAYLHALALHVVLNGETVVIYNPPTLWFQSIDSDAAEGKGKAEGNGLEDILDGLMAKHCENDKMMEEIVV
jgi:tRNA pseudouridine32 synthase/23S rRNA pseudouridine746 synthase